MSIKYFYNSNQESASGNLLVRLALVELFRRTDEHLFYVIYRALSFYLYFLKNKFFMTQIKADVETITMELLFGITCGVWLQWAIITDISSKLVCSWLHCHSSDPLRAHCYCFVRFYCRNWQSAVWHTFVLAISTMYWSPFTHSMTLKPSRSNTLACALPETTNMTSPVMLYCRALIWWLRRHKNSTTKTASLKHCYISF